MTRLGCWFRYGIHDPERQLVGGFRCRRCGKAAEDLHDMGFEGGGYVPALRRTFDRAPEGGLTRTTEYA